MKASFEKLIKMEPNDLHNFGIVINTCYGGFQLSDRALSILRDFMPESNNQYWEEHRQSPELIETITKLQSEANTPNSRLVVAYIPEKLKNYYEISDDDGRETLHVFPERLITTELAQISEKDIESIQNDSLRKKLTELINLSVEYVLANQEKIIK